MLPKVWSWAPLAMHRVASVYVRGKCGTIIVFIGHRIIMTKNTNLRWRPSSPIILKHVSQQAYSNSRIVQYLFANKIWCISVNVWPRYTRLCIFKMAAVHQVVRHIWFVILQYWTSHNISL